MLSSYKKMWKRTFDFRGRTSRRDYWLATLMNFIITFALLIPTEVGIFSMAFQTAEAIDSGETSIIIPYWLIAVGAIYVVYMIVTLIPGLSLLIRRFHDVGKSQLWIWVLIPALMLLCGVGYIVLLVMLCKAGDPMPNQYGNPDGQSNMYGGQNMYDNQTVMVTSAGVQYTNQQHWANPQGNYQPQGGFSQQGGFQQPYQQQGGFQQPNQQPDFNKQYQDYLQQQQAAMQNQNSGGDVWK